MQRNSRSPRRALIAKLQPRRRGPEDSCRKHHADAKRRGPRRSACSTVRQLNFPGGSSEDDDVLDGSGTALAAVSAFPPAAAGASVTTETLERTGLRANPPGAAQATGLA